MSGWIILKGFTLSGFNCLGFFGVISLKMNVLNSWSCFLWEKSTFMTVAAF